MDNNNTTNPSANQQNTTNSTSDPLHLVKPSKWTKDHEKILIDWADKAMCYRWLHSKSNDKLTKLNTYLTIPVIIMSTITGTANFAAERVPIQYRGYYSMAIGGINIFAGIITTIQQFLKVSEINEAHRVSSIAWDKFYRKIKVELAKPPPERQNVYDFLKACTEEFDRLIETSPVIESKIIVLFNETFNNKNLDENKKKMFENLKKPEICDVLESIQGTVYKGEITTAKDNFKNIVHLAMDKNNQKQILISDFIESFQKEMLRFPSAQEVFNNINNNEQKLDITRDEIEKYILDNKERLQQTPVGLNQNVSDLSDLENGQV